MIYAAPGETGRAGGTIIGPRALSITSRRARGTPTASRCRPTNPFTSRSVKHFTACKKFTNDLCLVKMITFQNRGALERAQVCDRFEYTF